MKRQEIENHSRAAFYLQARATENPAPARVSWHKAETRARVYLERLEFSNATQTALSLYWESLGHVEPKRYSPEGLELSRLREAARKAVRAVSDSSAYRGHGGQSRYVGTWQPGKPGKFFCQDPESLLRNMKQASEIDSRLPRGYYDNPHGESGWHDNSGLVLGRVAQLPGRAGAARYVAGYEFGSSDSGGVTFDFSRIFEAPGHDCESTQTEAARYADSMAESEAETEREYQTAWQAGAAWRDLGDTIESARQEALDLLKERRAARGIAGQEFPATCKALRGAISGLLRDIQEARKERHKLAQGEAESLYWSWGRHDLSPLTAFSDGAGISMDHARGICS